MHTFVTSTGSISSGRVRASEVASPGVDAGGAVVCMNREMRRHGLPAPVAPWREPIQKLLPRLLAAANHAGIEDRVSPLTEGETWLAP